jgi:branched-chain amino acid transport system ATP-binding protein
MIATAGAPALELDGLVSGYAANAVLFDVALAIPRGEVATLLGRNGMGKTATVRAVMGLNRVTGGSVRLAGTRIEGWSADRIGRAGVSIVPEGRQIFPNLTVRENLVAFAANRAGSAEPWTLDRVLAFFPQLANRTSNMGNQLSGGEQQMLAIGRVLMTNPVLLILDEATEGLAPLVREEIWRCLAALKAAGQTILVIDKYVERLARFADRHTMLERGRVVWQGDAAAFRADRDAWHRHLGV